MSKADGAQTMLSLPKGGGAMQPLGEKFTPDLHTGTGNLSIPLALPEGRNGFHPSLTLAYSTGAGNGVFGLGWSLGVPGITRKTAKGIPRYRDAATDPAERDIFILTGTEDLVLIGAVTDENGVAAERYCPRTEGLFAEILHYRDRTRRLDYWRVRTRDGMTSFYGTARALPGRDPAATSDPARDTDVFAWRLTLTLDPFGNRIEYAYVDDSGDVDGHAWRQPLLSEIRYVDYGDPAAPSFLVRVAFEYEARPDAFSDFRAGFEIRSSRRCRSILVQTHADAVRPVRRYDFGYRADELTQFSQLLSIALVGFDDAGIEAREMPPLDFAYSSFTPDEVRARTFAPLEGFELPTRAFSDARLELVDLFGNGLPDMLEMGEEVRFWRNLGNGHFGTPDAMRLAPPQRLGMPGVQLVDADGDGRTDLLVTQRNVSGYFPLQFDGSWDRRAFRPHRFAPSFSLTDPEVRLVDLTGDGGTDALRSGSSFECFFNDPDEGWLPANVRRVRRAALEQFPNVNFSDPRVKWGDFTGDGLTDIALVHDGNVEFWPNRGYGRWGRRLHMRHGPRFPLNYDPRRILVGDVNGDGLADIVYVDDRRVSLWINQGGNAWSAEIVIRGTPPVTNADALRLVDLTGGGIAGILWTRDARDSRDDHYLFLDLTGGARPYLLTRMDNNRGAVTRIGYRPCTEDYLRDQRDAATRWITKLPFPVHVVARVEARDLISGGKQTAEYRYHQGHWDGKEREFRGFGIVEQIDSESFDRYHAPEAGAPAAVNQEYFSPPVMTRTWFHQGPVGDDPLSWRELDWRATFWSGDAPKLGHVDGVDTTLSRLRQRYAALPGEQRRRIERDALRTLRGSVLRTEVYALDGSALEERPYTVTETAFDLREEEAPATGNRRRIFFPFAVAQRHTQWERGDDPRSRFTYTPDRDARGMELTRIDIACPRGWREPDDAMPEAHYPATITRSVVARPVDTAVYIHDRLARSRTWEIVNAPLAAGRRLAEVRALADDTARLRLIADSLHFFDDDTTQPENGAFLGRQFAEVGRFGAMVRSETLVLDEASLSSGYGADRPSYLVPGATVTADADHPAGFVQSLPAMAGYVARAADAVYAGGLYCAPETRRYDFHGPGPVRGQRQESRDSLGAPRTYEYDPYDHFVLAIRDALGLEQRSRYDYRVMQVRELIDANGNRSRVEFSAGGLPITRWVMGKEGENAGDMNEPSSRVEYNLLAFHAARLANPNALVPVYTHTVSRVEHDSDADDIGASHECRDYADGFGRLLQQRTQWDRISYGASAFGGGAAILPADPEASDAAIVGVENPDPMRPNVLVSGATRYDNKGRVVERYEASFSQGWDYEPLPGGAPAGASRTTGKVVTFYDALGRNVRTRNADGSEERMLFGVPMDLAQPDAAGGFEPTPWETCAYDANDNAGRTHAASAAEYQHHWNTPTSVGYDPLGRPVYSVVRQRSAPGAALEEYRSESHYDIQGNLLRVVDRMHRVALRQSFDLMQQPLRIESIDAGLRVLVRGASGAEIERWDGKGARVLRAYDRAQRASRLWARDSGGQSITLRESCEYGDGGVATQPAAARAAARAANQLGRAVLQRDGAGEVRFTRSDFAGNLLEKSRAVISDAPLLAALDTPGDPARRFTVDWDTPPQLESAAVSTTRYDARGRAKSLRLPVDVNGVRAEIRPRFNAAGWLTAVALDGEEYLSRVVHDAKGQRVLVAYGNGLLTRFAYDPTTLNVVRMRTDRYVSTGLTLQPRGAPLQDATYLYDQVGNVLRSIERTPACGVRNNAEAPLFPALAAAMGAGDALVRRFQYDALYRLVEATGREANDIPVAGRPPSDDVREGFHSAGARAPDPAAARDTTRLYRERYVYDAMDNLLSVDHGTWSRHYGMAGETPRRWAEIAREHENAAVPWTGAQNNRLTHVGSLDPALAQSHFHDDGGNLLREGTARHFAWDYTDRLAAFAVRAGAGVASVEACYLYDGQGTRVKKLVRRGGTQVETTVYVDGVFERRTARGAANDTVHVLDGGSRLASRRSGAALPDEVGPTVRYLLGDHAGSVNVVAGGAGAADDDFVNREEYFPFGETSFGSFASKRYRFAGRERDEESGLGYHTARYYSPALQRWISTDPAGPVDQTNLYVAFNNSPLRFRDPSGTANGDQSGMPSDAGADNLAASKAVGGGVGKYTDSAAGGEKLPGGVQFKAGNVNDLPAPESKPRLLWSDGVCHEQDGTYFDNSDFAIQARNIQEAKAREQAQREFQRARAVARGEVDVVGAYHPPLPTDDIFLKSMERTGQYEAIINFGLAPVAEARVAAFLLRGGEITATTKGLIDAPKYTLAESDLLLRTNQQLDGKVIFFVGPEGPAATRAMRFSKGRVTYETLAPAGQGGVRADMKIIRNRLAADGVKEQPVWWTGTHGNGSGVIGPADNKFFIRERSFGPSYGMDVKCVNCVTRDALLAPTDGVSVYNWCFSSSVFLP